MNDPYIDKVCNQIEYIQNDIKSIIPHLKIKSYKVENIHARYVIKKWCEYIGLNIEIK